LIFLGWAFAWNEAEYRPATMPDDLTALPDPPLCVDLDDTLLRTDLLYEAILILVKRSPWSLLFLPIWLVRGRAHLKQQLVRRTAPAIECFPFRLDLVAYLRAERDRGRQLILVTAADESVARKVEEHLPLFSEVIASSGSVNLKGKAKARRLE